ncbi:uncharacterized protein LOC105664139 [Megachile rotundata]|uniref:uncharacterized protein LOC105664139 n=1 Tax=Megachile rotundata TaxID=143995 RepID=UPI003FD3B058
MKKRGQITVRLDNRHVVPYNPYLAKMFGCHINVEHLSGVRVIKYIFNYINKGHDVAHIAEIITSEPGNEIRRYRTMRYLGSSEAHWRLMKYNLYGLSHTVERLTVHTRNDRTVYFADGQAGHAANTAANRDTQLTAFFKLNAINPVAREYLYRDIPQNFVWSSQAKKWTAGVRQSNRIGRIFQVPPNNPELAATRILLHHVKGPRNWDELFSYEGRVYASAQEARHARGLIDSGTAFQETLDEAAQCQHPRAFRVLFGQLLVLTRPPNGASMWEQHKEELTHDLIRIYGTDDSLRFAHGLRDIRLIAEANMVDWTNLNFPKPPATALRQIAPFDEYVVPNEEYVSRLNTGHLTAYNAILDTLSSSYTGPTCFFLDGPGGTGKTFIYKALIQHFRNNGHVVIPSAWTGIAALLLPGGRTSHYFFKLPVPLTEHSNCNVSRASAAGQRLMAARLIIMDEASMCERRALTAMDRILKDLTGNSERPFGGKIILLGGDFRQCAPIIPNAPAGSNIAESIRSK